MERLSNSTKEIHTDSELALQNGGWNYRRLVQNKVTGADIDKSKNNADGEQLQQENVCRNVAILRKDVPEFGTYRVEVTITAKEENLQNITLFAGRRNMIERGIYIPKGTTYKKTFYQVVTPYIPALSSKRYEDKSVFISVAGIPSTKDSTDYTAPKTEKTQIIFNVTKEEVPVIWAAGDSTLTDQNAGIPYYPYGSCAGWAQILARYINKAVVCNLAHSGMTTNCFRDDGHYAILQEFAKPGDFLIIQFGHNDQKRRNLAALGGYSDNLRRYINESLLIGMEPIICSPISRIPLTLSEDEAKELSMARHYSLLQEYADAAKAVAKELNVPFVDLHEMTFKKWIELGDDAKDYFMKGDITHTNEYGAMLIADMFVEAIRSMWDACSCKNENMHINNYAEELADPTIKLLPEELPAPSPFEIEPPYLDIQDEPNYDGIRKAFKYGLLDPCVMYLHPQDVMPRGQLLMVMFNAFKMNGVRPYKKKYPDIKVDEWISGYVQALIDAGYMDEDKKAFRPDDPLTFGELANFLTKRYADICNQNSTSRKQNISANSILTRNDANSPMNRAQVYTVLAEFMDAVKEITGQVDSSFPEDAEVHPVH